METYKKTLSHLDQLLHYPETVVASVYGYYEGRIMGKQYVRKGVFAVTQERIIFISGKSRVQEFESIPIHEISAIKAQKGLLKQSLHIAIAEKMVSMKWIKFGDVQTFVQTVDQKIRSFEKVPVQTSENTEEKDKQVLLSKLAELFEQGLLTEPEFLNKRNLLLNKE